MTSKLVNFLSSLIFHIRYVFIDLASQDRQVEYYNARVLRVDLSLLMRIILEIVMINLKSVQRLSGNVLRIDTGNYCISAFWNIIYCRCTFMGGL